MFSNFFQFFPIIFQFLLRFFQFFQLFNGFEVLEPGVWARPWAWGLEAAPRPQNLQIIGKIGKTLIKIGKSLEKIGKNWKTYRFSMIFAENIGKPYVFLTFPIIC